MISCISAQKTHVWFIWDNTSNTFTFFAIGACPFCYLPWLLFDPALRVLKLNSEICVFAKIWKCTSVRKKTILKPPANILNPTPKIVQALVQSTFRMAVEMWIIERFEEACDTLLYFRQTTKKTNVKTWQTRRSCAV